MASIINLLTLVHVIGICLGVGSATVKSTLLLKSRVDLQYIPAFIKIVKPVTRILIIGFILATLSGVTALILGYPLLPVMVVKIVVVGLVWIIGPVIDNRILPTYLMHAPMAGDAPTKEFRIVQNKFVVLELSATLLFYVIVILGVLL